MRWIKGNCIVDSERVGGIRVCRGFACDDCPVAKRMEEQGIGGSFCYEWRRNHELEAMRLLGFIPYKEETVFTKNDIKPGMLIEAKNQIGAEGHTLPFLVGQKRTGELVAVNANECWFRLDTLCDDMTKGTTVIERIWSNPEYATECFRFNTDGRDLVWERKEMVKEVTMKEVEEMFGCKVKIVEE